MIRWLRIALAACLLLAPTSARAFPIRIDFTLNRSYAFLPPEDRTPAYGSGWFILDTDLLTQNGAATYTLPALVLEDFHMSYGSDQWRLPDLGSLHVDWNPAIPMDRLYQADWGPFCGWSLAGSDWWIHGGDRPTLAGGYLDAEYVDVMWNISPVVLAMPEPPSGVFLLLGLLAIGLMSRRRRPATGPAV
ncbi:MAG: hypothetical protein ACM3PF_12025 [Bacteroidota bacterium]